MNRAINFLIMVLCLFVAGPVYPSSEEQPLDNSDYSYGEVVQATDKDLTVLEYDYEMDQEQTVQYNVDASTALTNIAKVTQLAKGDTVEVYFKDVKGTRVAQTIIKDDTANPVDDQTPSP
jgi:hypothetical protein